MAGLASELVWREATGKVICPCRESNPGRMQTSVKRAPSGVDATIKDRLHHKMFTLQEIIIRQLQSQREHVSGGHHVTANVH